MTRYEYKTEEIPQSAIKAFTPSLNALGAEGWELVSTGTVTLKPRDLTLDMVYFIFKRPLQGGTK